MKEYSIKKIVAKIIFSVILAVIIGGAGALFIIYRGPSETYKKAFMEYIQDTNYSYLNDWFEGGSDE